MVFTLGRCRTWEKSGLTGDEAYVLAKRGKITEDLGPLKKEIGLIKEDTTALQKRQNVLVGSETGNPVSCDDAFAAPLCGLTVYGKSTQDGTPTPDAPVPIVSAGDSGTIVVTLSNGNDKTQTLILSTPNGLPGIPVTSGGNYTDQNGQQWVCDEVEALAQAYYDALDAEDSKKEATDDTETVS